MNFPTKASYTVKCDDLTFPVLLGEVPHKAAERAAQALADCWQYSVMLHKEVDGRETGFTKISPRSAVKRYA